MDISSADEIMKKTVRVWMGMLGIENYDKYPTRKGELEILLGETRWAHHQFLGCYAYTKIGYRISCTPR